MTFPPRRSSPQKPFVPRGQTSRPMVHQDLSCPLPASEPAHIHSHQIIREVKKKSKYIWECMHVKQDPRNTVEIEETRKVAAY